MLHLIQHDVFLTLFSVSLDKNSICCIRCSSKSLFWPVTHDAETGWNWQKKPISLAKIHHISTWVRDFFFIIIIGTNLFETFFGSIFTNLSSLSPIPLPIWKLLICCLSVFLLQLINWILFIAIYLAPSIYQFWDRTVSSNNIDCFQSVRQLNKIYVAKFGLKYVQTYLLYID